MSEWRGIAVCSFCGLTVNLAMKEILRRRLDGSALYCDEACAHAAATTLDVSVNIPANRR